MIIEKLEQLCFENKTNVTALCKEITGSTGNLSTWRKDNIKPKWLKAICEKFNVSADYLLEIDTNNPNTKILNISEDEKDLLCYFQKLSRKDQRLLLVQLEDTIEKQNSVAAEEEDGTLPGKSLA